MAFSIASLSERVRITDEQYGELQLRQLTGADADDLARLLRTSETPRDFAVGLVHQQLYSPDLSQNEISRWPDARLLQVAGKWAATDGGFGGAIQGPLIDFSELITGARKNFNEIRRHFDGAISSFFAVQASAITNFGVEQLLRDQVADAAHMATQKISLGTLREIDSVSQDLSISTLGILQDLRSTL